MSIKRKITLFFDNDNAQNGEGIYADLDVYDDKLEEEEYITEECKRNIGFTEDWIDAIPMAKKLAKQYNAEFNEEDYIY